MRACCVDHIVSVPRVFTPELDDGSCCDVDTSTVVVVAAVVDASLLDVVGESVVCSGGSVGCGSDEVVVEDSTRAVVVADVCGISVDEGSVVDELVGTADWLVDGSSADVVSESGLHWEYHSPCRTQVDPALQQEAPGQFLPPHWR